MIPTRSLTNKVTKLECWRNQHGEFQVIEEYPPETEFWAECHFALVRNGQITVRFPRQLSIEQWEAKYSQPNP